MSPPSIGIRSRASEKAPVHARAKLHICIVELQHEIAPMTVKSSIALRAAATTLSAACIPVPLGTDHRIIRVTTSLRRERGEVQGRRCVRAGPTEAGRGGCEPWLQAP